ncbi:hypothetical protein CDAR_393141 [Caerostris darwini]|uniref:Uncharacterized protein n=1 Tax=Caerostris darwini TaxID=1538125 RepID=A0AAV4RUH0_9ARAC|nr:hypothetical protein CDAR_393141 [Caerostris darwini]
MKGLIKKIMPLDWLVSLIIAILIVTIIKEFCIYQATFPSLMYFLLYQITTWCFIALLAMSVWGVGIDFYTLREE